MGLESSKIKRETPIPLSLESYKNSSFRKQMGLDIYETKMEDLNIKTSRELISHKEEIRKFLPYMICFIKDDPIIDETIELEIKISTLKTVFLDECNRGLFTKSKIPFGTCIPITEETDFIMNDPMIDLTEVSSADNNESLYKAWVNIRDNYYNINKAEKMTNIVMSEYKKKMYFIARKDIEEGEELVRAYGFTTWIMDSFPYLTNKNIIGFINFLEETLPLLENDPFYVKVSDLLKLIKCNINAFSLDKEEKIYLGSMIQFLLMLRSMI